MGSLLDGMLLQLLRGRRFSDVRELAEKAEFEVKQAKNQKINSVCGFAKTHGEVTPQTLEQLHAKAGAL